MEKTKVKFMFVENDTVVVIEHTTVNENRIGGFTFNNNYQFNSCDRDKLKKFFVNAFIRNSLRLTIELHKVTLFSGREILELEQFPSLLTNVVSLIDGPAGFVDVTYLTFELDRRSIKKITSLFVEQV